MPGAKGHKAVHACMIRLMTLGTAKHEEVAICLANQRIPNICRIAGAVCCGAIREHQLGQNTFCPNIIRSEQYQKFLGAAMAAPSS